MRIAILGSVALPIPPPAQGGTEWIAYHQAKGLAEKGHDILLIAAKGTAKHFTEQKTIRVLEIGGGDVVVGSNRSIRYDPATTEASRFLRKEIVYLSQVMQVLIDQKGSYDIILNNMRGEAVFIQIAQMLQKPFINVMHLNLFVELADLFRQHKTHVITISNAQRKDFPDLSYLATVYNGVDTTQFSFNAAPNEYLLMMGTIGRHKNQKEAITVAKEAGMKLILAGKVRDQDYFEELKKDIDGEQIQYFGELSFDQKLKLYQEAKAFIFPIAWEEPFGLVMIEAMSCGTPVVAYNKGAVSEVVIDGLTGYVVDNHIQMVEAIKKVTTIKREDCRKQVEDNFTIEHMIAAYEKALVSL
ncbi:MAG: glycosyltransferase family 4 protein [Candidatus Levybacteria bacterium]|nr:glycosyltransferase family 4 protein [Candidatus Levybacteria bacterium]